MTKKIKHVSELPEWFDLKNYKKANSISDYEWYIQLIIRKFCITREHLLGLIEPIEVVRKKTFVGLHHHYFFRHWHDILSKINIESFIIKNTITNTKNPAISPLTPRTVFNIQKYLPPDRKTYQSEFTDYLIDAIQSATPETLCIDLSETYTKCLNAPKQDWLHEPIYKSLPEHLKAEGLIHINLDFTDAQLIEHFKKWLTDIRTELQTEMKSKSFKQSDFNSWALYGILPYLDLKIWEKENNVSIPNRVMADAIYPAGVGGEETDPSTIREIVFP